MGSAICCPRTESSNASAFSVKTLSITPTTVKKQVYHLFEEYNWVVAYAATFHLDLLIPAFVGIVLCFFGGTFVTLIAAVEACNLIYATKHFSFSQLNYVVIIFNLSYFLI